MSVVTLSPLAVEKLKGIIVQEGESELALRVFVSGGGCAGLSYGMALDPEVQQEDLVMEQDGIRVVIDSRSALYLRGSEIDYVDQLMGGGFTLQNPNAVSTCACGHSFKTTAADGTPTPCGH